MERTQETKVVVITGATGSVGRAATAAMASLGWHVIMACRNPRKAEEVRREILNGMPQASVECLTLDLESRQSIHAFVESLGGRTIDALFNNAGIINRQFRTNDEDMEHTMAVNYIGPMILTHLMIPLFIPGAHIVNMVSLTVHFAHIDQSWPTWDEDHFSQLGTYASSKKALLYYTIALAKHYPQFVINVADPGVVNSNMISMGRWFDPLADLFFRPFTSSGEKGARPAIAALQTDLRMHYFVGKGARPIARRYVQDPLVERLWELSKRFIG